MKQTLFMLAVGALFVGCESHNVTPYTNADVLTQSGIATLQKANAKAFPPKIEMYMTSINTNTAANSTLRYSNP